MEYKQKRKRSNLIQSIGNGFVWFAHTFKKGDLLTKLSYLFMGTSNLFRGQIIKGLLYLLFQASYALFMLSYGISAIGGLKELGTLEQTKVINPDTGIYEYTKGDNSMLILLYGVESAIITIIFIALWISNIKSAIKVQELKKAGKAIPGFLDDVKDLFHLNVHKTLLFMPLSGLLLFTILPLVFMVLIAFTGFDAEHQPPGNLFTWEGLKNFKIILFSGDKLRETFWGILGWTFIWAVFATSLNYVFGMVLAIMINKKGIKLKKFWRTIFVLSIAVPLFVSLLSVRLILAKDGALNMLLLESGFIKSALPFWEDPTWARISVIVVNLWVGIPHTMLITTGILMNIPSELYESAKIDGANGFKTFVKITLPYMLFVTTPYLITQFIGNINNFNVIFFLSNGGPATNSYYGGAGKTDLLVTWLYKLTVNNKDYSYASTIGIMIFIISATISLITYRRTTSYKNEEGFQ